MKQAGWVAFGEPVGEMLGGLAYDTIRFVYEDALVAIHDFVLTQSTDISRPGAGTAAAAGAGAGAAAGAGAGAGVGKQPCKGMHSTWKVW